MTGLFVVFEGGDSVGKTTQVRLLAGYLAERGIDHVVTRQPGGTAIGAQLRGTTPPLAVSIPDRVNESHGTHRWYAGEDVGAVQETHSPAAGGGTLRYAPRITRSRAS